MELSRLDYEPTRVQIGDIAVSDTRVQTPVGIFPLKGTTWRVSNQAYMTESIPAWAVVCAIVFFVFCLLGLLFLLVKEQKLHGVMQVTVDGPSFSHTTLIPVYNQAVIYNINAYVDWIRGQVVGLSA